MLQAMENTKLTKKTVVDYLENKLETSGYQLNRSIKDLTDDLEKIINESSNKDFRQVSKNIARLIRDLTSIQETATELATISENLKAIKLISEDSDSK
jgi:hypothetical protein